MRNPEWMTIAPRVPEIASAQADDIPAEPEDEVIFASTAKAGYRMINLSRLRRLAFAILAAMLVTAGSAAALQPFTAKDLASLDRVSDPQISPDGRLVVYDLRSTDYDANTSSHALWLIDLQAKPAAPRRLAASDGGATNPRWSPDGRTIYFLSSRAGGAQVWRTDLEGAKAVQVTKLPMEVGTFRVSPDSRHLVVSVAVFPDCDTLDCTKARQDARSVTKANGVLYDKLFVRHWDEWADGTPATALGRNPGFRGQYGRRAGARDEGIRRRRAQQTLRRR